MRHNESPSLDGVIDPGGVLLHPYCYVCNHSALQDEIGFCQMFAEIDENVITPAKILSDILEIEISTDLAHSQIVCVNCNMMCLEYQQLIQRAETIRIEMTMAYNQTVMKLAGLTEKDLKENEGATGSTEEHLESALHNFNKELMSIEDVFQIDGIAPNAIEGDPVQNPDHMEENLSKMGLVWPSGSADSQQPINVTSLLPADDEAESEKVSDAKEEQSQLVGSENSSNDLATAATLMISENSAPDLLSSEHSLEQYISEPSKAIVEVASEDGTVYCIYGDVIESYSDGEENNDTASNIETTENEIEYDEIIVESSIQDSENRLKTTTEKTTDTVSESSVEKSDDTTPQTVNNADNSSSHPLFVKIDGIYYCTLCSTRGQVDSYSIKTITLHLKKEHGEKILICERCDAMFYRRPTYNEHMDQHTIEDCRDFCCDVCGIEFTEARTLRLHRKTHAAVNKMWSCDTCGKKFTSKTVYEVHKNTHLGLKPFKCSVCSKDFSSKYILTVHMKTHKDRVRKFACSKCDSAFYSRSNLLHHEKTHIGSRDFPCSDCGKSFLSQHNLNVHKVIHASTKPFACRTCGKPFARKAEVADHERIHTGEKPFSCDICDASFAQRSNLYSHKRLTHFNDKRFKCETCGACFKRRRLLLYHTRATHTGERPYKCDLCDATFVYPEHFQKHKRIHTGTKPFACEVCNKTFNSRDNRNAHRYVHSDKKPFECVSCGSGFMRKSQLYTHMQKKGHLNETIVINQPRITTSHEYESESVHEPVVGDQQNPGGSYEEEDAEDMTESAEYYLQDTEDQQGDTSWSNLLEQDVNETD
ncbi:zinc finger protein 436-like [Anopheles ziemanni]|uniref:zinc finger protein 436-like n=1 Tax=Anopheles coustani TaxID=139045 RepID=UPI00265A8C3D|nr:zinc finger protein 436-like [Anopheles coustani]XP_058129522.1 zinc finger protein 436-like [Anopheles coustani]XP_058170075.1 zinc finger protein 436-like [Anopheles ziemanni]